MRRRRFCALLGGAALAPLTAFPARASPPGTCGVSVARVDGWPGASGAEEGLIDRTALCAMTDRIAASSDLNIHAVLVVRKGKLVFERYSGATTKYPAAFSAAAWRTSPSMPTRCTT